MQLVRIRVPLGYLVAYLVAVMLERLALSAGTAEAFFWPAAGVAALWLLSGRTRGQVLLDAVLLVLGTTVLDVLLGADLGVAVLLGLSNLAVGVTVRGISALLEHRSFWDSLPRRISGTRDLWGVGLASLAAALASAAPGLLAVALESGGLDWDTTWLWVVRGACSTFVVTASVLGLLTTVLRAHARRGLSAILTPSPRRFWGAELAAVAVISLAAAIIVFAADKALPIAFLMIVASTWIGGRFSPAVGGLYTITLASLAALCTQVGRGPFGPIEDLTTRAVIVQVYAMVTAVIVLMLSLGASERAALLARAVESESRATSRADLLDAVTTVMVDGLVVVGADNQVLLSNPAAEEMAGIGPVRSQVGTARAHGMSLTDGTPIPLEEMPRARALRGEHVAPMDLLRIDPETGEQRILSVSAVPLQPEVGDTLAVLGMRDVTKVRSQRRELENFAGVVAHDLKAPLTGVISWAEILEEQLADTERGGDQELVHSVERIRSSADRMANLISDLLTYTQAQNAQLSLQSVDLDELVEQISGELRETHHLEIPIVEHAPLGRVLADRTLVRQLLTNVMGNAVKYVAPGVLPHLVIGSAPTEDMLEIWVSDNGLGIPDQDLGRIFDSFFRASSTSDYPGTGLGLAICARTVERHGGRIWARKGLDGQGTTMIFTLPLDPAQLEPQPQSELESQPEAETVALNVAEPLSAERLGATS
jgi:signal transduction histidine kinase/PAS domain-containing protein